MKLLSIIFNRPQTIDMRRTALAAIVAPLMKKGRKTSNADISNGYKETAEWLRTGFETDTDKGSMYYGLHHALSSIADEIRNAPEGAPHIAIKRTDLEALKAGMPQLHEAAHRLEVMGRTNQQTLYDVMAYRVESVYLNLQSYLQGKNIQPASGRALESYVPKGR